MTEVKDAHRPWQALRNKFLRRITGRYMHPGAEAPSGFRLARSVGLRPHSHASLHPHFCKPWKPAVSFIGLAKTSYTAGRYVQCCLKLVGNYIK
jgi:hypothetical protein